MSLEISMRATCHYLREGVLVGSFSLLSQWRWNLSAETADVLENMETLEGIMYELGFLPHKKVVGLVAQLKCIYTHARSMGNKQEKLEAVVQQERYDIIAIKIWL